MNNSSGNNLADKHLVDRVLAGDAPAFGSIIKNTERLVAQVVFKMISNPEDRKDIAQDIYIKVYKGLSAFKFQSKLSTWIAQVSYNTCLDHLRKKKLVLRENFPDEHEKEADDTGGHNRSVGNYDGAADMQLLQKDLSGILKEEIEKLPPVYKLLIVLYHQEELSYEEMEQITALPAGTIKSYLFRARKTLKNNILLNYKKDDL